MQSLHDFTKLFKILLKELIQINIEIEKRNRFKGMFYKMYNRTEDIMFSIVQKIPKKIMPSFLMEWLQRYTDKRIAELNKQIVHDKWKSMKLNKAVDSIRQQNINKAPSGE